MEAGTQAASHYIAWSTLSDLGTVTMGLEQGLVVSSMMSCFYMLSTLALIVWQRAWRITALGCVLRSWHTRWFSPGSVKNTFINWFPSLLSSLFLMGIRYSSRWMRFWFCSVVERERQELRNEYWFYLPFKQINMIVLSAFLLCRLQEQQYTVTQLEFVRLCRPVIGAAQRAGSWWTCGAFRTMRTTNRTYVVIWS